MNSTSISFGFPKGANKPLAPHALFPFSYFLAQHHQWLCSSFLAVSSKCKELKKAERSQGWRTSLSLWKASCRPVMLLHTTLISIFTVLFRVVIMTILDYATASGRNCLFHLPNSPESLRARWGLQVGSCFVILSTL